MKRLPVTAAFSLVEDRTAVDRHVLQMFSTCLTCITAGIWHTEALSQNQQQQHPCQCVDEHPIPPIWRHEKLIRLKTRCHATPLYR